MTKKITAYIIAVFAFSSCNHDVTNDRTEEWQDLISTNYSFVDIEYISVLTIVSHYK